MPNAQPRRNADSRSGYNRFAPTTHLTLPHAVPDDLNARLTELEIRVAFQDDLLGTLNGYVASLNGDMQAAQREITRLREALEGLRVALSHDIADEPPPPHY